MKKVSFCKTKAISCALTPLFLSAFHFVYAQCTPTSAATSYASNNGSRGAMFNITATNTVVIKSFDGNLYGGTTAKYEIYYKSGSYVGSETNAAAWTFAGSVNSLYVAANNVPTPIPIPLNVVIPAGQTYAFYVTNTASGGLNYISSAVTNVTLVSDANITMIGGVGKAYPFSSTYSYRLFSGTVHYTVGQSGEGASLTTTNRSYSAEQNSSGSTVYEYSPGLCSDLICKVEASGTNPISGTTSTKVWIENTQPLSYVKRHYEITPSVNASTATGKVTLYFTQAEFDAFNAINSSKLPTGSADNDGKANLLIEKRSGTSNNSTGLPNTYTGTIANLDPVDTDIIWNAVSSRWEISVDVNGFSGFFVKTTGMTLPVSWLQVNATIGIDNRSTLNWKVEELDVHKYEVQKSSNGIEFTKIMEINSKGDGANNYSITDPEMISATAYYRLKQIGIDGRSSYSSIIKLFNRSNGNISVYPNPVKNKVTVTVSRDAVGSIAKLVDRDGRLLQQLNISQQNFMIDMSSYATGIYLLQLSNGIVQKIIKE